jgi:hypothetical protein
VQENGVVIPHVGKDEASMTWGQFVLWLQIYGMRAKHDEVWCRWAYQCWGRLLAPESGFMECDDKISLQLGHELLTRQLDLTRAGAVRHPAVFDEYEGGEEESEAAQRALDDYSEEQIQRDLEEEILLDLELRTEDHSDACGCSKHLPRKQARQREERKRMNAQMRLERRDVERAREA